MRKVWILEKFASREEMNESLAKWNDCISNLEAFPEGNEEILKAAKEAAINYEKMIAENPDGRWYGFEGKIIYNQFCRCAADAIRRNPEGKFRVMEAEMADDATSWIGYIPVKVNEGVLRYLYAIK